MKGEIPMLIKNGRVHDGLGHVAVQDIRIMEDKIVELGVNLAVADGEEMFDAAEMEITPGFIQAISNWGVNGSATEIRPSSQDNCESSNPITPELDAFYAFNGRAATVQQLGAFGITSCGVAPADSNLFGGKIAAFVVDGVNPYKMCLKRDIGMMSSVSGSIKQVYGAKQQAPQTRMWIFGSFELQLKQALEYKEDPAGKRDDKLTALKEVVEGRLPLFVACDTAVSVEHVKNIVGKYPNIQLVLVNGFGLTGDEAWIVEKKIPLVVRTASNPLDLMAMSLDWKAIRKLVEQGVPVALSGTCATMFCAREDLLWNSAEMMRVMPDSETVLSMITSTPAKILGIDDQTGSIQEGLRADLVIWSANPMESYQAHVVRTFMGGKAIYQEGDEMRCM